ncbi:MAG: PQQ-dependent sugar dehydrogenase [bacterium]|nr:PQQ-dependent sugar dehydrogenase [bacterium]
MPCESINPMITPSSFGKKKIVIAAGVIAGLTLLFFGARYFGILESGLGQGEIHKFFSDISDSSKEVPYVIEEVVSGLEVPWSIVWTSPTRMLIAERPGRLRVFVDGKLLDRPLTTFHDVSSDGEEGLMGVALDPDYATNHYLYACYAYTKEGGKESEMVGRMVRLVDDGVAATIDRVLVDHIPSAQFHAGCRVAFGPDGKLYVTTGDATDGKLAQRLDSFAGKILRVNSDGSIPADNPFPDSRVWSFGHRNPQGIAWHPKTGVMYETEHGPSIFDGPAGGDEVNLVVRGGNYGWPLVSHEKTRDGTIAPLLLFTPAEAPASAMFYRGVALPQFTDNFFFGALKGEGLIRVIFDERDPSKVVRYEKLGDVRFGRIRAVAQGPDGAIYFSTSNRDGRGAPTASDDRIFRITPRLSF